MTNNAQNNKGDRYSTILIGFGIIVAWGLIEVAYRILI